MATKLETLLAETSFIEHEQLPLLVDTLAVHRLIELLVGHLEFLLDGAGRVEAMLLRQGILVVRIGSERFGSSGIQDIRFVIDVTW